MPVIEAVPPYSPLHVPANAPTIYLSGRSRPSDPWHINASRHLRRAASRGADAIIANQYTGDRHLRGSAEHDAWRDEYFERAHQHGAFLVWVSSARVGAAFGREISSILDIKRSDPGLLVVAGAGGNCPIQKRLEARDRFTEHGIELHSTLAAACHATIEQLGL